MKSYISSNFESSDELSQKGSNKQEFYYVNSYHKAQDQMQKGLKIPPNQNTTEISSLNSIISERPYPNQLILNQKEQNLCYLNDESYEVNAIPNTQQSHGQVLSKMMGNMKNTDFIQKYSLNHEFKDNFVKAPIIENDQRKQLKQDSQNLYQQEKQQQNVFCDKGLDNNIHQTYLNSQFQQQNSQQINYKINDLNLSSGIEGYDVEIKSPISSNRLLDIDLSYSRLSVFPQEICRMIQIQKINIDFNFITKLPEEIGNLSELKQLFASDNKLFALPKSFSKLQNLDFLNISNNYIDPFPIELCSLINLETLHIQINYFVSLPLEFANLEKLQEFQMDWFKYLVPQMKLQQWNQLVLIIIRQECKRLLQTESEQRNQISYIQTYTTFENITQSNQNSSQDRFQQNKESTQSIKSSDALQDEIEERAKDIEQSQNKEITKPKNINNPQIQCATKLNKDLSFSDFLSLFYKDPISYLSQCDNKGRNVFHSSALNQDISIIKAATLCQLDKKVINHLDNDSQTPLSLSLLENKLLSAKILLFFGADPHFGGGKYGTCLHIAVVKMDIEIVGLILSKGGDPNSRDFEGNTPLHLIFSIFKRNQKKSEAIIELLIEKGANCNIKNFENWSVLHQSIKRMQTEAIKWLAQNQKFGQKFNWDVQGGSKQLSLLHLAAKLGYTDIIQILLERVDPFLFSIDNQLARDFGQSNNLISKLLKKKETQLIDKHFQNINQSSEFCKGGANQDSEIQKYKHFNSTFFIQNKSFPIEKYEKLIEEKLAIAKNINNPKIEKNEQKFQRMSTYSLTSRNQRDNFQWNIQKKYPKDDSNKQGDSIENQKESMKIQSLENSPNCQNQQKNDPFLEELQQICQFINNQAILCQFDQSTVYKTQKIYLKNRKDDIVNSGKEHIKQDQNISEEEKIYSCDLQEQDEQSILQSGEDNQFKIRQTNIKASQKKLRNIEDGSKKMEDHSFQTFIYTDENIPEEHTCDINNNFLYFDKFHSKSNNSEQKFESEIIYNNYLKQSMNIFIDERVNITSKQQLLLLFQQQLMIKEDNNFSIQKCEQNCYRQDFSGGYTERYQDNKIKHCCFNQRLLNSSHLYKEEKAKSKIIKEYLPLFLQSVIKHNSQKDQDMLISTQICELIANIQNDKVISFFQEQAKQLIQQGSNQHFLIKNMIDLYLYANKCQTQKKKIYPFYSKFNSKQKNSLQSHSIKLQLQGSNKIQNNSVPATFEVNIPILGLSVINKECSQKYQRNQNDQESLENKNRSITGHANENTKNNFSPKEQFSQGLNYIPLQCKEKEEDISLKEKKSFSLYCQYLAPNSNQQIEQIYPITSRITKSNNADSFHSFTKSFSKENLNTQSKMVDNLKQQDQIISNVTQQTNIKQENNSQATVTNSRKDNQTLSLNKRRFERNQSINTREFQMQKSNNDGDVSHNSIKYIDLTIFKSKLQSASQQLRNPSSITYREQTSLKREIQTTRNNSHQDQDYIKNQLKDFSTLTIKNKNSTPNTPNTERLRSAKNQQSNNNTQLLNRTISLKGNSFKDASFSTKLKEKNSEINPIKIEQLNPQQKQGMGSAKKLTKTQQVFIRKNSEDINSTLSQSKQRIQDQNLSKKNSIGTPLVNFNINNVQSDKYCNFNQYNQNQQNIIQNQSEQIIQKQNQQQQIQQTLNKSPKLRQNSLSKQQQNQISKVIK